MFLFSHSYFEYFKPANIVSRIVSGKIQYLNHRKHNVVYYNMFKKRKIKKIFLRFLENQLTKLSVFLLFNFRGKNEDKKFKKVKLTIQWVG